MGNNQNSRPNGFPVLLLLLMVAIFVWIFAQNRQGSTESTITYKEFTSYVESDKVEAVSIHQNKSVPTGVLTVSLDGVSGKPNAQTLYVSDVSKVADYLDENKISYTMDNVKDESNLLSNLLPIGSMILIVILFIFMMSRQSGAGSQAMKFGSSRAKLVDSSDKNINFAHVAGLREEKEELAEVVDFLKDPQKYLRMGARIPKGLLLEGPPGTGKTLLAKAVAGEAGVPFYTISGSDFVEMFVGVGASRVRDLFANAKKNAPCIIFIDEIDAVARRRGTGMGGGHDEREQTLNQLLVEMDGFGVHQGIIVIAATNRVDILDPAILRPGRFDRKVVVGRPDVRGREEILKVHAANKPLAEDVDLEQIARTTAGFVGADLENLMNEAAIIAAKTSRAFLTQEDIRQAFIKVGIGAEKKSKVISDKDKRITAFHEAGHAILFHVLPDIGPVHMISVIPTGNGAAGYTMPLPEKDEMFNTRGKMLQDIMASLGGRIAEEMVFDDITTGASQDIKQASAMARAMVTKFGMSEKIGLIDYDNDSEDVFIGRDLMHSSRHYSEKVQASIDDEVKAIIDECYAEARRIITENRNVLDATAELLIEKEKITREEFEALFVKPDEAAESAPTE